MAETIWNENLEVSHQKGDKKMERYKEGGTVDKKKKKRIPGVKESTKYSVSGSVGKKVPKPTEMVFMKSGVKPPTKAEWDAMSHEQQQRLALQMQKVQETKVHGQVKDKTMKLRIPKADKKKKFVPQYREGGYPYKSPGKFKGLTEEEKAAISKGVKAVKKVAKKTYAKVKPGLDKATKQRKDAADYSAHVVGTVIGKTERGTKKVVKATVKGTKKVAKKTAKTAKTMIEKVKTFEKKTRKKSPHKSAGKFGREGGSVSYSGIYKTPQSKSKYPGMG